MGTNYAPLVTDLFLFCYERDFMTSLSVDNQADMDLNFFLFLFVITAAGVVPCGGCKTVKSLPALIFSADYIFTFGPLRSKNLF